MVPGCRDGGLEDGDLAYRTYYSIGSGVEVWHMGSEGREMLRDEISWFVFFMPLSVYGLIHVIVEAGGQASLLR